MKIFQLTALTSFLTCRVYAKDCSAVNCYNNDMKDISTAGMLKWNALESILNLPECPTGNYDTFGRLTPSPNNCV
jgi:hypothetical protein